MERRTLGEGRYELLGEIGRGGMATVWRALDTRLGVERAVKILQPQNTRTTRTARERFDREARLMARLEHPHIVPVHDVGVDGDRIFMVMSLLRGGALSDWLERRGPMAPRQACTVTEGVLRALSIAHAHGVIHRDIKPQNVLIDDQGQPRLSDFGIARVLEEDGALTKTGAVMGTYAFMPPEQRSSARDADARSDIYAIGALMVSLLTAQLPYDLHHPDAFALQTAALPEPLRAFVARCTKFAPSDRYAGAIDALAALQAAVAQLPPGPNEGPDEAPSILASPLLAEPQSTLYTMPPDAPDPAPAQPPLPLSPPPTQTRWWLAGALGGGAVLLLSAAGIGAVLVGLALWGWSRWGPDPAPPDRDPVSPPAPAAPAGEVVSAAPEPVEIPEAAVLEPAPAVPAEPPAPEPAPALPPPVPRAAPAPVPAPVPAPAPPEPTLSVRVVAVPSATLEVDGRAVGTTPWSGPLTHGTHLLGFRKEDGTLALRRPITVVDGGKLEYCWVLATEEPCSR